jgi:hypothetical protein
MVVDALKLKRLIDGLLCFVSHRDEIPSLHSIASSARATGRT